MGIMHGVRELLLVKACHALRRRGSRTQKIPPATKDFISFMVVLADQGANLATSQARRIYIARREVYLQWAFIVKREVVEFLRGGSSTKVEMVLAKRAKLSGAVRIAQPNAKRATGLHLNI
jgi:hypothetical protein